MTDTSPVGMVQVTPSQIVWLPKRLVRSLTRISTPTRQPFYASRSPGPSAAEPGSRRRAVATLTGTTTLAATW